MNKKNSGPTRVDLKHLLEPLQKEADNQGTKLHYLCKKILREHVVKTNPNLILTEHKEIKEDTAVQLRLRELKGPLQMEASELDKPLQWLAFKVFKNYVENLNKQQCSKP